jgi:DNA-directed RNA polymerase specialized sigma24 family protein
VDRRIVTNLAFDVMKHRRKFRHEELAGSEPAARRDDADVAAMSNDIEARIDAAIESLPEMQRLVARLHLIEEMAHAEIAAVLDPARAPCGRTSPMRERS